jgi:hypothetical protein
MSINQLIAGGIQLPRFESPINMMAQLSQLEAAREANELRRMQMAQMQRQQEQEMELMNALQSGQPLSFQQAARGGRTGLSAFELQQGQLEAQRKREEAQRLQRAVPFAVAARRAVNTPVETLEESDSLLMGARQELADLGISSPEIDKKFVSLKLLGTPEARREGLETLVSSIPGLEQTLAARQKEAAGIDKTKAETRKLNLEAAQVGKPQQFAPPEILRLIAERDALPENSPARAELQKRIDAMGKPTGTTVYVGPQGKPLTPLQTKADEKFADDFVAWEFGGGANATKNVAQIGRALDEIQNGKTPLSGPLIGIQPDLLLSVTNPKALDVRQRVEQVAQESLRAILGAQFTQKEGDAFIRRVFNPSLKPEVNAARLRAMFLQLETAAKQKQEMVDYARKNGTISGYEGPRPSIQDFYDAVDNANEPPSRGSAGGERTPTAAPSQAVRLKGATREELNAEVSKLPSGTVYIGPDNITRTKP